MVLSDARRIDRDSAARIHALQSRPSRHSRNQRLILVDLAGITALCPFSAVCLVLRKVRPQAHFVRRVS